MTIHIGSGVIRELPGLLKQLAARKIFLVTGKQSFERSGARALFEKLLHDFDTANFYREGFYTRTEHVGDGVCQFKESAPDVIVAVGGGRVLDLAKLIRFFSFVDVSVADYLAGNIRFPSSTVPLVAIPTTAGSGSEATQFAVVYLDGFKHSVSHSSIMPEHAIIDADLTANLPEAVTASCGMDALSQSIESYWSVRASDESRAFSREGIALALDNLREAVRSGSARAREAMSRSAFLSGQAINLTTTTAPHAVSYPLTSIYGVPHGHAVALTLPEFFVYNSQLSESDVTDQRGVDFVLRSIEELNSMLACSSASDSRDALRLLMHDIGLSPDLRAAGVGSIEDVRNIVAMTNPERLNNNPRRISQERLSKMLADLIKEP